MDVLATGMVSALGYDVHTSCAAARAGLSRPSELPFVVLEGDKSPGLAVGHAASLLTDGFQGDARLTRMLSGALADLFSNLDPDAVAGRTLGFYVALPPVDRLWQGMGLFLGEAARSQYLDRLGPAPPVDDATRARGVLDRALRLAGAPKALRAPAPVVRVSTVGHAAVPVLLARAQKDLDAGEVDMGVVVGVDSLVADSVLPWLSLTGRLKCADGPAGLSPGEAAACILVTRRGESRHARPVASIGLASAQPSTSRLIEGEPADGLVQSELLKGLCASMGVRDLPWIVTDQNGELFRATDWGTCLVRLRAAGITVGPELWYPVSSFGDVGAATGAAAVCLVAEAFMRGYAPSSRACLVTTSDGPARAGCVIARREH